MVPKSCVTDTAMYNLDNHFKSIGKAGSTQETPIR